jgi:lipoprotein-anchoring transpeptidase ErfK/SrfK
MLCIHALRLAGSTLAAAIVFGTPAAAEPLALNDPVGFPGSIFQQVMPQQPLQDERSVEPSAPPANSVVPERLQRQIVAYDTREAPGTIVIDTPHTYLYYVLGGGRAIRYGIGVGRDGFTWSGVQSISDKQEWPDWHPPAEMIARQPYLPRMMAGGPGNPLGARALYLGHTQYRIHGTNDPTTIGKHVSSGCIRLTNENIIDLFSRVQVGTKVVVLPNTGTRAQRQAPAHHVAQNEAAQPVAAHRSLFTGSSASRLY